MVERGDRDAAPAGYMGRAPSGMKGITGFDEARLESEQQVSPAFRVEGQAVVERPGHDESAQRAHATTVDAIFGTGYDDGVFPRCVGVQPRMLGVQIAFDAAACGRIEEGRINEMHRIHRTSCDPLVASKLRARIAPL